MPRVKKPHVPGTPYASAPGPLPVSKRPRLGPGYEPKVGGAPVAPPQEDDGTNSAGLPREWRTVVLTFLPEEERAFWDCIALVDRLPPSDGMGVVSAELWPYFEKAVKNLRGEMPLRSVGHAVAVMARMVLEEHA